MSMNLEFVDAKDRRVGFPAQTPTDFTYAFYAVKDLNERLEMFAGLMIGWGWDQETIDDRLDQLKDKLTDPTLTLVIV